jgi:hypothetical protein
LVHQAEIVLGGIVLLVGCLPKPTGSGGVQAFLSDAEGGNTVQQATAGAVHVITQETKANVLFESRDKDRPGSWIHRTYLAK